MYATALYGPAFSIQSIHKQEMRSAFLNTAI